MGKKITRVRPTLAPQFKRNAVNLVAPERKSSAEVARQSGVAPQHLNKPINLINARRLSVGAEVRARVR